MKMVKTLPEFEYFTVFLNNRNFFSKMRILKVTDYAAISRGPILQVEMHLGEGSGPAVRLSVKALAGPCRTEPTIVSEVGIRRITVFGTGFYHQLKR